MARVSNSLASTRNCVFSLCRAEAERLFTSPGELLAALDEELELEELTDTLATLSTVSCKRGGKKQNKVLSCKCLIRFGHVTLSWNWVGVTAFSLLSSRGQQSPAFCRVWKRWR